MPARPPPIARAYANADRARIARRILRYGNEARHAAPGFILRTHEPTRALGSNEKHVDVRGRHDRAVMNRETVREHQIRAVLEVRRDRFQIDARLLFVGRENHHEIGFGNRVLHGVDGKAVFFRRGG